MSVDNLSQDTSGASSAWVCAARLKRIAVPRTADVLKELQTNSTTPDHSTGHRTLHCHFTVTLYCYQVPATENAVKSTASATLPPGLSSRDLNFESLLASTYAVLNKSGQPLMPKVHWHKDTGTGY
jgi:hypothetical protein